MEIPEGTISVRELRRFLGKLPPNIPATVIHVPAPNSCVIVGPDGSAQLVSDEDGGNIFIRISLD